MGKYNPNKHSKEPIMCPRDKCRRKNAPVESDDFSPRCWECNTFLNVTPVEQGQEVKVVVDDIHESGSGVGKTDDGYVVMVEGVLPPAKAKVKITNVHPNYSEARLIEKIDNSDEVSEEDSQEEEGDDPALGSRENYWG